MGDASHNTPATTSLTCCLCSPPPSPSPPQALDAFWAAIEANGGNLTKVRNDKDMLADLCKQHITSSEVFRMAQLERMNNKDIEMSTKDNVGVIVRQ
jgi:hypothetical protein